MNNSESPSLAETGEQVINEAVASEESMEAKLRKMDEDKKKLEQSERAKVDQFIGGVRPLVQGVLVKDLGPRVGGLYDGENRYIAENVLYVTGSVNQTIAQITEIWDHEKYHEEHDHTAPMTTGSSAQGDAIVTIGEWKFTDEALIEGLTVAQTGDQFVSDGYKEFKGDLLTAVDAAGITISDVERAVDKKNLTLIDDADRETADQKEEVAVSN